MKQCITVTTRTLQLIRKSQLPCTYVIVVNTIFRIDKSVIQVNEISHSIILNTFFNRISYLRANIFLLGWLNFSCLPHNYIFLRGGLNNVKRYFLVKLIDG